MNANELITVSDIVKALGGNKVIAQKTNNAVSAVSNWRKAGLFPPNTYVLIQTELKDIGKSAPDSLWKMKVPEVAQ